MRIKNITFSLSPQELGIPLNFRAIGIKTLNVFRLLKNKTSNFFHFVISKMREIKTTKDRTFAQSDYQKKPRMNFTKLLKPMKFLVIVLVAGGILIGAARLINSITSSKSSSSDRLEVKSAKAEQILNKEYVFPLRNEDEEKIAEIKYFLEKVELRDEIIVKGQRATAVKGRTFLIFTLKITNEYKSDIEIDSRDYVRLSVNGNADEWLAPEIHNDPVEVQAISTKFVRLGFPINDSDSNLVLRVGEIDEEKQEFPLDIK